MPTIEISADQREFLATLQAELEEEHVGRYGTVCPSDAIQFLIDQYGDGETVGQVGAADTEAGETRGNGGDEEGEDRLEAMMQLLDEYDEKWEVVDADDGKYEVSLPDGSTEHVRTKDDVRAALFRHYR